MAALAASGKTSLAVDIMLRTLGLEICADTVSLGLAVVDKQEWGTGVWRWASCCACWGASPTLLCGLRLLAALLCPTPRHSSSATT